jgi:hypothetical protein
MKVTIVKSSSLFGGKLEDSEAMFLTQARKAHCMSAEVWTRLNRGLLPYKVSESGTLIEATYSEYNKLKETKGIMWLSPDVVPRVNELYVIEAEMRKTMGAVLQEVRKMMEEKKDENLY